MSYRSVFAPGLFNGQTIIITGGGSGIGRATAHELAALGATVALVGRDQQKLDTVSREIADDGGNAITQSFDIREEHLVQQGVAAILAKAGRIDGLVNNAGGQFASPAAVISGKGFDAVVRTNLTGGFLMARECFTQWMSANGGAIVNVVADMWNGMPGMAHSGAARAGMVNLTETTAFEWGAFNVRVNAVAPGWIASSGMDRYPPEVRSVLRGLKDNVPLGRLGTEAEIAAAITFLLSPAAAFISGTTLRVDGAAPNFKSHWPRTPRTSPAPAFEGFHRAVAPKVLSE
jgi:citronellol/citronellal dehydrogenase